MTKLESTASKGVRRDVVQLSIANKDGHVTVTPGDQSRFVIKVENAIRACQAYVDADVMRNRIDLLLSRLGEWITKQPRNLRGAWVTLSDGHLLFLVEREKADYDPEFEGSLVDLELDIANDSDLGVIPITTLALPRVSDEALRTFINPQVALHFKPLSRKQRGKS